MLTRSERLIIIHIKKYIAWAPLWKRSILDLFGDEWLSFPRNVLTVHRRSEIVPETVPYCSSAQYRSSLTQNPAQNGQFTIFILPILHLACLPKFCITIVFNLLLGITVCDPQRNWRQCKILGDKPRCITGNVKMVNIICVLDTDQESKIQHHNDR